MRIAITGGIGSGKSTVVKKLLALLQEPVEYKLFDFDARVHALYADAEFCAELEAAFGTSVRKELSDQAFTDPAMKTRLQLMSAVRLKTDLALALAEPNVIVEFPLLFEAGWCMEQFSLVIAVVCDPEVQLQRVLARDTIPEAKARAIMAAQLRPDVKAALSDTVIDTTHSLGELESLAQSIKDGALQLRAISDTGSQAIWEALQAAYCEPHRAYHSLSHIKALLLGCDRIQPRVKHLRAMRLAIWFHDFVYRVDAAYPNNESASAGAMVALLSEHQPDLLDHEELGVNTVDLAIELILATKGHAVVSKWFDDKPSAAETARQFLDINLEILCQSQHVIDKFERDVWSEFQQYSDADYARGRCEALQSFLDRPQVYYSPEFTAQESRARENLMKLVAHWGAFAARA